MKFADIQRLLLEDGEKNKQSVPKDVQKKIIATARQLVVKNNKKLGRLVTPAEIEQCVDAAIKHFGFQPKSPEAAGIRKAAIKRQQEDQSKRSPQSSQPNPEQKPKADAPQSFQQKTDAESLRFKVGTLAAKIIERNNGNHTANELISNDDIARCVDAALKHYGVTKERSDYEFIRTSTIKQQIAAQDYIRKNGDQYEEPEDISKTVPFGWHPRTGKPFKSKEEREQFKQQMDREQQGIKTRTMRNGQWHND